MRIDHKYVGTRHLVAASYDAFSDSDGICGAAKKILVFTLRTKTVALKRQN